MVLLDVNAPRSEIIDLEDSDDEEEDSEEAKIGELTLEIIHSNRENFDFKSKDLLRLEINYCYLLIILDVNTFIFCVFRNFRRSIANGSSGGTHPRYMYAQII